MSYHEDEVDLENDIDNEHLLDSSDEEIEQEDIMVNSND